MLSKDSLTLVIMAAGIGSRYGGTKQVEAVGPQGEWILEYSIQDAFEAGFQRVILVIQPDMEAMFLERFSKRGWEDRVDFAAQTLFTALPDNLENFSKFSRRTRPWGTAHALLAASKFIKAGFAVLNADDYYGTQTLFLLSQFLRDAQGASSRGALVGYALENTLSPNGPVSRALCQLDARGTLKHLVEHTKIISGPNGILDLNSPSAILNPESIVSLNAWAFTEDFLPILRQGLVRFLSSLNEENFLNAEYYLPSAVYLALQNGFEISVLKSHECYAGLTYSADLKELKELISRR